MKDNFNLDSTKVNVTDRSPLTPECIGPKIIMSPDYRSFKSVVRFLRNNAEKFGGYHFYIGKLSQDTINGEEKQQAGNSSQSIELFVNVAGCQNGIRRNIVYFSSNPQKRYLLDIGDDKITCTDGYNKVQCSLDERGNIKSANKTVRVLKGEKREAKILEIDPSEIKNEIPEFDLLRQVAQKCNEFDKAKEDEMDPR